MSDGQHAHCSMFCRKCGYALAGLSENRCPECARPFDPADRRTFAVRPSSWLVRRWIRRIGVVVLSVALGLGAVAAWLYAGWRSDYPAVTVVRSAGLSPAIYERRIGPAWPWRLVPSRMHYLGDRANHLRFNQMPVLILSRSSVTDDHMPLVAEFASLSTLYLDSTPITSNGLASLASCGHLEWLDLSYTAVDDAGLVHLGAMSSLRGLRLRGTRVTDAGLAYLADLKSLEHLDLADLPITSQGLAHLATLSNLRRLDLDGTAIDDSAIPHLRALRTLEALRMRRTAVTERGLQPLRALPNLWYVDLRTTQAPPDGVRRFTQSIQQLRESRSQP